MGNLKKNSLSTDVVNHNSDLLVSTFVVKCQVATLLVAVQCTHE